ncbi:MAG: hypothetical protein KAJ56_01870, partial [Candidatus Aenigmarchaeota archaeon]|nr:hypothetical protein [Candidatus Aenigmarchaeota archaeon]
WYDNQNLPEYLNFSNMEIVEDDDLQINIDLYETESGSMSAGTVGGVKKLQFLSTCDGVWFILERPIGGWNTQP